MAAVGYTPISLYYSATASAVPSAANLVAGELALNTADGKLYYKSLAGVVTLLAGATSGPAGGSNTQVQFNSSGVLAGSSNLTWNGSTLAVTGASTTTSSGNSTVTTGIYENTSTGTGAINRFRLNGGTSSAFFEVQGSGFSGTNITNGPTTSALAIWTGTNIPVSIGVNASEIGRFSSTGLSVAPGVLTLGTSLVYDAFINTPENMYFNVDSDGNSTGNFFVWGTDRSGTTGGTEFMRIAGATGGVGAVGIGYSSLTSVGDNGLAVLGNVGIGTSSPGAKLVSEVSGSTAQLKLTQTSYASYNFKVNTDSSLTIDKDGTTRLTVDTSGNLGLGVTPSAWGSPFLGAFEGKAGTGLVGRSDAAQTFLFNNSYFNGTNYIRKAAGYANYILLDGFSGGMGFAIAGTSTAGSTATFTQAMTLDASGNLGIGTTSPTERLHIYKAGANVRARFVADADFSASLMLVSNSRESFVYNFNGDLNIYNSYASGNNIFYTNSTERARIDSSGNLLVGLTSALGSQLGVQAAGGNGTSFTLRHTSATAGKFRLAGIDSSNNYLVYNNSNVGMYMTDGGTSWTATSDETQKVLTNTFTGAIEFLSTVRATRGRYKTDDESISRSFLIAQDWQEYLPEAISEKDGILGLSYQDTIPVLVKAIQELTARITALEGA